MYKYTFPYVLHRKQNFTNKRKIENVVAQFSNWSLEDDENMYPLGCILTEETPIGSHL